MSDSQDIPIVACCGLVCSDCGMFLKKQCDGCHGSPRFRNCLVKSCVKERGYATCAECTTCTDLRQCRKLNNFISKIFGLIFRKNRIANLERIRAEGGGRSTHE